MYHFINHFLTFLLVSPKSVFSIEDKGWISSCKNEFNISSIECSNGIWLNRAIDPGCICIKGLWVLNSKSCDDNDLLLFGNKHCFFISKKVRKITFLGSPTSPFSPTTFISEKNKKLTYQRYIEGSKFHGNQSIRIIRIHPQTNYYYRQETQPSICMDPAHGNPLFFPNTISSSILKEKFTDEVSIIKVRKSPNFPKFFEDSNQKNCQPQNISSKHLQFDTFHLSRGQGFYIGKEEKIFSDSKCLENCETSLKREKRFLPGGQYDVLGYYGYSYAKEKPFDSKTLEKYITEQTIRLIKNELNYIKFLRTDPEFHFNDTTYQFLQMSRVILNSICPLTQVPLSLSKSLLRLFRFILLERRETNMYGKGDVDETDHASVMAALEACYNDSGTFQFTENFDTDNCVTPAPPAAPAAPSPELDAEGNAIAAPPSGPDAPAGKELCDCKISFSGVALNETTNNTCTGLDPDQEWGYPKRDLIVESMWKIFQFTHFQCAKYFEADGRAAALFHERVERLFHADVIFRWMMPGTNADMVWNYFYMGYDLEQYAKAVDTCLCAAQSWSAYPYPMVRPLVPVFKKKKRSVIVANSQHEIISQHQPPAAQCLQHPWDPIQGVGSSLC